MATGSDRLCSTAQLAAGKAVWAWDEALAYRPAVVLRVSSDGRLAELDLLTGERSSADVASLLPRSEHVSCGDCLSLPHLDDANLLDNLHGRYDNGQIYTYVAHVLLAINPYRDLPSLYGPVAMKPYGSRVGTAGSGVQRGRPPPHAYAVAAVALRGLQRGEAQAIVISGESGAGKTETTKVVLRYLEANAGRRRCSGLPQDSSSGTVSLAPCGEDSLNAMSRVLESFGHAWTVRNRNSSRFGKYMLVRLDGDRLKARVTTYLLEVSRAARLLPGERSFNIFYELTAGLSPEDKARLRLSRGVHGREDGGRDESAIVDQQDFALLEGRDAPQVPSVSDAAGLTELLAALQVLGLRGGFADSIFEVLAGILHLSNVFAKANRAEQDNSEDVRICEASVASAAHLLGFDADDLRRTLIRRRVGAANRKSLCDPADEVPRTRAQAGRVFRSLVVTLYGRLFAVVVAQMNAVLGHLATDGTPELGVLDIYGFEVLAKNSLEQLLINLANERLHQFFVERVLEMEQLVYLREGLRYREVGLEDTSQPMRAIMMFLSVLDDQGKLGVTDDARFCDVAVRAAEGVGSTLKGGEKAIRPAPRRTPRGSSGAHAGAPVFLVSHYAGVVQYVQDGWLEGNDARALPEVDELLCHSRAPFVRDRLAVAVAHGKDGATPAQVRSGNGGSASGARKFTSVSRQHCVDLDSLITALGKAHLQFIRCFIPNSRQVPNQVDRPYLLKQLRNCGTPALLKVMHQGYPHRIDLVDVAKQFAPLLPERLRHSSSRTFAQTLMLALGFKKSDWTVGLTQLFLRAGQLAVLDELRQGSVLPTESQLEVAARTVMRNRWRSCVQAVMFLVWCLRLARRRAKLRAHLQQQEELLQQRKRDEEEERRKHQLQTEREEQEHVAKLAEAAARSAAADEAVRVDHLLAGAQLHLQSKIDAFAMNRRHLSTGAFVSPSILAAAESTITGVVSGATADSLAEERLHDGVPFRSLRKRRRCEPCGGGLTHCLFGCDGLDSFKFHQAPKRRKLG